MQRPQRIGYFRSPAAHELPFILLGWEISNEMIISLHEQKVPSGLIGGSFGRSATTHGTGPKSIMDLTAMCISQSI